MQDSNQQLANKLIDNLKLLVEYWNDYFKQKKNVSLDSFNGVFIENIDVNILEKSFDIITNTNNKKKNYANQESVINFIDNEFSRLFNTYSEYFDFTPEAISDIAYIVHGSYNYRNILFIDLNIEKLNHYLGWSEKIWKNLDLIEKDNK